LRALGYVECRTIIVEYRPSCGDFVMLPRLARELVQIPVIVTDGGAGVAQIAVDATRAIPIVMGTSGDPVSSGLAASLARPGGNVTGFTLNVTDLCEKRVDLLRLVFPGATGATVLLNPSSRGPSSNGTESRVQASSRTRFGFLRGRSSPRAILSGNDKA
jgi:putative ABC transport system substrate-binding protein